MYEFEPAKEQYSRYDAFDKELGVIVEIKCRNKHYDDALIEKIKFDWNKQYALDNGYTFIYAVSMPSNTGESIYLFEPSALEECGCDFKWHTKKLPENTEFGCRNWIDKEVGYLHIKDASMVIHKVKE